MSGELQRRLIHAAGAGFPLLYVLYDRVGFGMNWSALQSLLLFAAGVGLVLEGLRLSGRVDWWIYDELTREYEQDYVAGYALYLVGMAVASLLFAPPVAVAAMLMLAIGDPISGLLSSGGLGKSASVLAAMFGVCFALALPFVSPFAAVLGAAVAALADGAKPVVASYVIDDNLGIPLGAGVAMTVVAALL